MVSFGLCNVSNLVNKSERIYKIREGEMTFKVMVIDDRPVVMELREKRRERSKRGRSGGSPMTPCGSYEYEVLGIIRIVY